MSIIGIIILCFISFWVGAIALLIIASISEVIFNINHENQPDDSHLCAECMGDGCKERRVDQYV